MHRSRRGRIAVALVLFTAVALAVLLAPSAPAPSTRAPGATAAGRHATARRAIVTHTAPPLHTTPSSPLSDPRAPGQGTDELPDLAQIQDDAARQLGLAVLDVFVARADGETPELAIVQACGDITGTQDGYATLLLPPGSCDVVAWRMDGLLRTRSDTTHLDLSAGGHYEVDLTLPTERTGGLGVGIRPTDDGMEVVSVHEGSPAWVMGLERGDLIVEVDGLPTAALDMDDFISVMTGPEGTDVDFVVAYAGDTGLVEEPLLLTRAVLGDDRPSNPAPAR